jgi:cell division protein FtsA
MAAKVHYAVGLDAGSETTRCVVCAVEGRRIRYLGGAEVRSAGWHKSRIADQRAASNSILLAAQEAERQAQVPIESVVAGIGGSTARGANSRGSVDLGRPREIEQRDVNRAVSRASHVQLVEDRMVLQLFPQDFVVDDHPGHRNPRRMLASHLEVNVHVITASMQEHSCLIAAINQAHLSVEETVFEALAACYASVLPEDRREGVACLDIGAQSSELVVYYGDSLQLACPIPVSGDHFTRDLVRGLRIGFEEAVLVKEEYGCADSQPAAGNCLVELAPRDGPAAKEVSLRTLHQILEARAVDLFQQVKRELARVAMDRALIGGIVLTGAGARLPGLCDVAERILNCPSRKGLGIGIKDWPDEMMDPAWAAAAGLAMYSGRLKLQDERERQQIGLLGRMLR